MDAETNRRRSEGDNLKKTQKSQFGPLDRTISLNEDEALHPDNYGLEGKRSKSGADSCYNLNEIGNDEASFEFSKGQIFDSPNTEGTTISGNFVVPLIQVSEVD